MSPRREPWAFGVVLAGLVAGLLGESLFGGKVLSPGDVLWVSASFREVAGARYEPSNRLLMDPVLQFEPWLEFSRASLRRGRVPLWNDLAGCGAPHLANGQSAVFDPFHVIAYLGKLPEAHAWMAAARLWMAGLGMFLLARSWKLGAWGRWFAGLVFPFCGFLVGWLLFPSASVAVWLPWLFLASDRVLDRPGLKTIGGLALVVGMAFLGGHIQTSAHMLLAVGLYVAWRGWACQGGGTFPSHFSSHERRPSPALRAPSPGGERGDSEETALRWGVLGWVGGVLLGVAVAAVEIVPLGAYLAKSPVWGDRDRERLPAWSLSSPRLLDAACTALPYAFGSQRRGHPNVARALGVHNLNESAGGFVGLATLVWLAPLSLSSRREVPRVRFLAGLALFGALGAFGIPPVDNLLRALPVLNVTDNRRLALWVAFGLSLLGGIGIDRLSASARGTIGSPWVSCWVFAACGCLVTAGLVGRSGDSLRARAIEHYAQAAAETPGADPTVYHDRAERQVRQVLTFYPRYLGLAAGHLLALAALAEALRRGFLGVRTVRGGVLGLTLIDLFAFGFGLNPALATDDDRPEGPVITYLRREVGPSGRIVALGEELSPNAAMRYGLADVRNYDSVELARSLAWFAPLYSPGPEASTSRRSITWEGVIRARDRLREASVTAIVAPTPPPAGAFRRVDRVGSVWIARLEGRPWASSESRRASLRVSRDSGTIAAEVDSPDADRIIFRDTFDSGWHATVDGKPAAIEPFRGTFLAVPVTAGRHAIALRYAPREVEMALAISLSAAVATVLALTGFHPFRSTRIVAQGLGRTQAVGLESFS